MSQLGGNLLVPMGLTSSRPNLAPLLGGIRHNDFGLGGSGLPYGAPVHDRYRPSVQSIPNGEDCARRVLKSNSCLGLTVRSWRLGSCIMHLYALWRQHASALTFGLQRHRKLCLVPAVSHCLGAIGEHHAPLCLFIFVFVFGSVG